MAAAEGLIPNWGVLALSGEFGTEKGEMGSMGCRLAVHDRAAAVETAALKGEWQLGFLNPLVLRRRDKMRNDETDPPPVNLTRGVC
ncbi:hypothetical protein V6N12_009450 [Hibiscus sabdariffa]|uniref:Uncharacterized protein n=1 Tax=Hibiscus sabdariffa TaxID=183260 RepID=A0ABR2EB12_9ROSI